MRSVEVPGQSAVGAEIEPGGFPGSQLIRLTLRAPEGCVTTPIDELLVHGEVAGHAVTQTVHTSGTDRTPCG